jgi:hypothetical protein
MEVQARQDELMSAIGSSLNDIKVQVSEYRKIANRNRRLHVGFATLLAVLGVAAPALVTYQTQVDNEWLKLSAILLTSLVGASAVLQATFGWNDAYRRSSLTALALDELQANAESQLTESLATTDRLASTIRLSELRTGLHREKRRILREQIEAELSIASHESSTASPRVSGGGDTK